MDCVNLSVLNWVGFIIEIALKKTESPFLCQRHSKCWRYIISTSSTKTNKQKICLRKWVKKKVDFSIQLSETYTQKQTNKSPHQKSPIITHTHKIKKMMLPTKEQRFTSIKPAWKWREKKAAAQFTIYLCLLVKKKFA